MEDPRIWSMLVYSGGWVGSLLLFYIIVCHHFSFCRPRAPPLTWNPAKKHIRCLLPGRISHLFLGIGCALVQPNGIAVSRKTVPRPLVGWHACLASRCCREHQGYYGSWTCLCSVFCRLRVGLKSVCPSRTCREAVEERLPRSEWEQKWLLALQ